MTGGDCWDQLSVKLHKVDIIIIILHNAFVPLIRSKSFWDLTAARHAQSHDFPSGL